MKCYKNCMQMLIKRIYKVRTFCFQDRRVSMASRRRIEHYEGWLTVRRIEAGRLITNGPLFFGVNHYIIFKDTVT